MDDKGFVYTKCFTLQMFHGLPLVFPPTHSVLRTPSLTPPPGVGGKFWYVSSSGLVCADGETPEDFTLEFPEHGRIAIRGKNGRYLRGDQGGNLKGDGLRPHSTALWEY